MPQRTSPPLLTASGLETVLVFHHRDPDLAGQPQLGRAARLRRRGARAGEPGGGLTAEEAETYHRPQIASFRAAGADHVTVMTVTHAPEAIGIVRAAVAENMTVVVSFTVETDAFLPSGHPLLDAIAEVDAATDGAALHFGINCAHPDHFAPVLSGAQRHVARIGLIRANASRMSHDAELDEAEKLDDGDPLELASHYAGILADHPQLKVLGGCCGTDVRHIEAIGRVCLSQSR